MEIRPLLNNDQAALEQFLGRHLESSLTLLHQCRAHGLERSLQNHAGIFYGAFSAKELEGVVAHFADRSLIVQAPSGLNKLIPELIRHTPFAVEGIFGPPGQANQTLALLLEDRSQVQMNEDGCLYELALEMLILPQNLCTGRLTADVAETDHLPFLRQWYGDYLTETLRAKNNPLKRQEGQRAADRSVHDQRAWILCDDEQPVSCCEISALLDEAVQVGLIFTPSEYRCRRYARSVVAACLYAAWKQSIPKAYIFCNKSNSAALKLLSILGFTPSDTYKRILLRQPVRFQV